MSKKQDKKIITCHSCKEEYYENDNIISYSDNYGVCFDCVDSFKDVKEELVSEIEKNEKGVLHDKPFMENFKSPIEIVKYLDQFIVGQEKAKKVLSVAAYNHYKRYKINDDTMEKSNVLITGPSGSGKTYMNQILADILNVPLYIADVTKLTESGYIGEDVDSILQGLYKKADYDIEKAERGIILLDEFDKLANVKSSESVGTTSVQEELLKIIEGGEYSIPVSGTRHRSDDMFTINTKNILFICCGAFENIYETVEKRLNKNSSNIGFSADVNTKVDNKYTLLNEITNEDFLSYGLKKEILGRIPVKTYVKELSLKDYIDILTKTKVSVLHTYEKLLKSDNVNLIFEDGFIKLLAEKSKNENLGARGLKTTLEEYLLEIMFESPEYNSRNINEIIITEKYFHSKNIKDNIFKSNKKEKKEKL
tara:strand:- start:10335 stop:11603 length:1269 start_codon:yes stop_codon:yes gene_type:complete